MSSYRGLFNRVGLPLPRSARVKVDYDLVQKDPKITEQLKQVVNFKDFKGKQVLVEGRKENLISERTYQANVKRLERWVSSSHRKIHDLNQNTGVRTKPKVRTSDQLLQESADGRERLAKLMTHNLDPESSRQHSHMSQSWRAPGPRQTESASGRNQPSVDSRKHVPESSSYGNRNDEALAPNASQTEELPLRLEDIQIQDFDN